MGQKCSLKMLHRLTVSLCEKVGEGKECCQLLQVTLDACITFIEHLQSRIVTSYKTYIE